MRPLSGIRVLDFTTLLPGPLATLMLAEAGAEVIKLERPPVGDELRTYTPRIGEDSIVFELLNRGKRSITVDLKDAGAREALLPLLESCDVLMEQFRPGVMDRLGLGYEAIARINPRIVYCSITGYGQSGPKADKAAHDLNYVAESGMLSLAAREGQAPALPPALIADIGAGAYPAVINVLLGLQQRAATGRGCYIDISMNDNLLPFMYSAIGSGFGAGQWPRGGCTAETGGSPRYNIYRTADDRFLAAACVEDRFWVKFCEVIDLPQPLRSDKIDATATQAGIAKAVYAQTSQHWRRAFAGVDACASIVATVEEGLNDAHYRARGVFAHRVTAGGRELPALPMPLAASFRSEPSAADYPTLGESNAWFSGGAAKA